jgi:hypothetical protein
MQQKVTSQDEALEISMKLEAIPIGESSPGMSQLLNQLTSLSLQVWTTPTLFKTGSHS